MPKHLNLTGARFGALTAVSRIGRINKQTYWRLICDCGNEHSASLGNLRSGQVSSCGCQRGEVRRKQLITHGYSKTRLHNIWCGMRNRCNLPSVNCYDQYGGRGITVCTEWNSFPAFRAWALANGYSDELTIDRWPDKNGNYEPSNCRWATPAQQARNRRSSRMLTINGESKALAEWLDVVGITDESERMRVRKLPSPETEISARLRDGVACT